MSLRGRHRLLPTTVVKIVGTCHGCHPSSCGLAAIALPASHLIIPDARTAICGFLQVEIVGSNTVYGWGLESMISHQVLGYGIVKKSMIVEYHPGLRAIVYITA
jgi:hypothetical protein